MSMKGLFLIPIVFAMTIFVSCNPIREIKKTIKKTGHISFPNPMEDAKTGTLIGGTPRKLLMIAPHDACFPDEMEGLRIEESISVPSKFKSFNFSGGAKAGLLDLLGAGSGVMSAGAEYHYAKTVSLEMEGARIEYFDSVKLAKYFRGDFISREGVSYSMSDECKEYLQYTGFITQALKVDKLKFTFMNRHGVKMNINPQNVGSFLDIGLNTSYHIENNTSLVIDTPKYIGYVLGRFKPEDDGIVLYRASKTIFNKFIFKSIDIFNGSNMYMSNRSIRVDLYNEDGYFNEEITLDENLIDSSSEFEDL